MLTADQLYLTQAQFDALLQVRDLLRGDVIQHDKDDAENTFDRETDHAPGAPDVPLFNMGTAAATYECGTIACIGGNMSLILQGVDLSKPKIIVDYSQASEADKFVFAYKPHSLGDPRSRSHRHNPGLTALFYPRELGSMDEYNLETISDWERIPPAAAADAIDNFLETGKPDWEAIGRKHDIPLNEVYLDLKREAGL